MIHPGVYEFYRGRALQAPLYGFKCGHDMLEMILHCIACDDLLTSDEIDSIINLCEQAHIKMMEDNYNEREHE